MAWLQVDPSGSFHIGFRFGGKKFKRSLRTTSRDEAESRRIRLVENIRLVESGRLEIPVGVDVPTFLLSDGKLLTKFVLTELVTLQQLFDAFLTSVPEGNLEPTTLRCIRIHQRHLAHHFGEGFPVQNLSVAELQEYVSRRSRDRGLRGRCVGANTIGKEIATFRSVWTWAVDMGKLKGEFPRKGLRLPKQIEKPPFQTWMEIEQQIQRGRLSEEEQADLWDCLFLSLEEVDELLDLVRDAARQPFIYPMFVMAAHTGARRSELLRSEVSDFRDGTVVIRERKRVKGKQSTRRVPISSRLGVAINDWLEIHPGDRHTFCQRMVVHSRKKCSCPTPITPDEATDHFQRTLKGSKWEKVRGWHCLRHSFCSNCAMKGIDQRIIDAWVGHTTESMRRRYRHLFPSAEKQAMETVYG